MHAKWLWGVIALLLAVVAYLAFVQPVFVAETVAKVCPNMNDAECLRLKAESAMEILAKKETTDFLLMLATAGLFAVTYNLARSTKKLWVSTEDALKHAKQTAARQLRAYICFRDTFIDIELTPGFKPIMRYELHNNGQTPAYKTQIHIEIIFAPEMADFSARPGVVPGPKFIVNPGTHLQNMFEVWPDGLTQDMVAQMRANTSTIHMYGRVDYVDADGEGHHTDLRLHYSPTDKPDVGTNRYRLRVAHIGNDAT